MQSHSKIALALVIVGLVAIFGYPFAQTFFQERDSVALSDARNTRGQIVIGYDNWVGYYPLCSGEMVREMRRQGYLLRCEDDNANYQERFERLRSGDLDFAVATVDSWMRTARSQNYPGTIIAVLDQSKGGDAIIANNDTARSLEDLKRQASLTIAYTKDSPSEFFLRSVDLHFDIFSHVPSVQEIYSDGSSDALNQLKSGNADVAVLWEPDVSAALETGQFTRILGTESTENLIVDVLVASHETNRQSKKGQALLTSYFKVLKYYRDNPERLISELETHTTLPKAQVQQLVKGVQWVSLSDNQNYWFSQDEALISVIDSVATTLNQGQGNNDRWYPRGDPYRLINSTPIAEAYQTLANTIARDDFGNHNTITNFTALTPTQWDNMIEVGSLKTRDIVFISGSNDVSDDGEFHLQQTIRDISHYPNFRIKVTGHTSARGDPELNKALSKERADAVKNWLVNVAGIPPNRIYAQGKGGEVPLLQQPNESPNNYARRLRRVEISLVMEQF